MRKQKSGYFRERRPRSKERDYAAARLDGVITKIKRVMQSALAKIQKTLMQPEVKKAGKEQIKEKARESIRDKLAKGKLDADRDNRERSGSVRGGSLRLRNTIWSYEASDFLRKPGVFFSVWR